MQNSQYSKKQLKTNGNSWFLYINKTITELMGITKDDCRVTLLFEKKKLYVQKYLDNNKNLLTKKLMKRGGGYGLILSQPMLALLSVNPEKDFIDIDMEDGILVIQKSD